MDILILGATGNTGSEVVNQLKQVNADFGVMVRKAEAAAKFDLEDSQIRLGDYGDITAMTQAMTGVKKIYVAMPAHPSYRQWIENVLTAAKTAGIQQIVKLSGMGAKADAGSEIIRVHAATDEMVKASGINYTLVQPNSFFQNLYGSLATINEMGMFFLPLADAKQSVVDIRDVGAVVVAALTQEGHEGEVYQLSGPQALTFAEQADIISRAVGKEIRYVAVSGEDAAAEMKQAGVDDWLAEHLAEIMVWFSEGHYACVTDDVARATGKPARSFEAFAKEFAKAVQA
ncbi:SDR family oxidoreductase [Corallincola platygyrae]|uniref:SDR family oxidoreductase n=1 Tax=Corallincola platygyrae TaxID=1193278 RepID=A0ABW4XRP5_9GAMM